LAWIVIDFFVRYFNESALNKKVRYCSQSQTSDKPFSTPHLTFRFLLYKCYVQILTNCFVISVILQHFSDNVLKFIRLSCLSVALSLWIYQLCCFSPNQIWIHFLHTNRKSVFLEQPSANEVVLKINLNSWTIAIYTSMQY
jgi:hypothetical protein